MKWSNFKKKHKIQIGLAALAIIIAVIAISQRLGIFADVITTISNTASLTYEDNGQTLQVNSNAVLTEIVTSPSASPTATPSTSPSSITPSASPSPSSSPPSSPSPEISLTPTPTLTPTAVTGGGGGGSGYWYNYKMAIANKLAAAKKSLINAKLLLIMRLKGPQNKLGSPKIDYVNISPDPSQVGQTIKFEVGWSGTDQARIYACKANLMFERNCAKAYWCDYGPKNSSPAWCYYTPQLQNRGLNHYYIFACEDNRCSVGSAGFFRVVK